MNVFFFFILIFANYIELILKSLVVLIEINKLTVNLDFFLVLQVATLTIF